MAHADPVLDQHEVSSNRLDDPILDALEPKPLLIDCLQNEILSSWTLFVNCMISLLAGFLLPFVVAFGIEWGR